MLAKKFLFLCTSLGLCLAFVFVVHVGHHSKNRKNKNLKESFFFFGCFCAACSAIFLPSHSRHRPWYKNHVTFPTCRDWWPLLKYAELINNVCCTAHADCMECEHQCFIFHTWANQGNRRFNWVNLSGSKNINFISYGPRFKSFP